MVLKVKGSILFFYPYMWINIKLKYTSNFKTRLLNPIQAKTTSSLKGINYTGGKLKNNDIFNYNLTSNTFRSLKLLSKNPLVSSGSTSKLSIGNISFFLKKSRLSRHTTLRAPYRYKKGRYQLGQSNYRLNVSLKLFIPNFDEKKGSAHVGNCSLRSTAAILDSSTKTFLNLDTNISNLNKIQVVTPIKDINFFRISNF